jgi:hypothetical protein
MRRVLIAWVGVSDLLGPSKETAGDVGPVAQALKVREFERVVLLENFSKPEHQNMLPPYVAWLKARTKAEVVERPVELTGPTDWGGIYKAALHACQAQERDSALTFHLSPGSPPMAAVWVLLGKTVFSAELIEGHRVVAPVADLRGDDLLGGDERDCQLRFRAIAVHAPAPVHGACR